MNQLHQSRSKNVRLRQLAHLRQQTRWPKYGCIGDYHGGKYECEFVSPYTRSANNVNALLMILLQDWASDKVLKESFLQDRVSIGHDPTRQTNHRLKQLLVEHFGFYLKDVYATNVFPFVKRGSMGASIPKSDLARAAREFALPQIEIVKPRIAICLGKAAYNAVALAGNKRPALTLADAMNNPFMIGASGVWCQPHPGRNSVDQVRKSWSKMARAYNSTSHRQSSKIA